MRHPDPAAASRDATVPTAVRRSASGAPSGQPPDAAAPRRAAVGRADLLRALADGGEVALAAMARRLGFTERVAEEPRAPSGSGASAPAVAPEVPEITANAEPWAPIPFWRLDHIEYLAPAAPPGPPRVEPIGLLGLEVLPGLRARSPGLARDARLWPALQRILASPVPSRVVDGAALGRILGRGEPLRRLPYRRLAAFAPRVTVLVDRSERLVPFWDDQVHLVALLRQRLGKASLREVDYRHGEEAPWREGRRFHRRPPMEPGAPVLALGDLGFLGGATPTRAWAEAAAAARAAGGAQLGALVCCLPAAWDRATARQWAAIDWERPTRAARPATPLDDGERLARAERLLVLVAFAARVEPGLLRAVRRLLPASEADALTEFDAWHHPDVAGSASSALSLGVELRQHLQVRFATELADDVKRGVVEAMRAFRAGLPSETWLDEVLGLASAAALPPGTLSAAEVDEARQLWRRIDATLNGDPSSRAAPTVAQFVRRSLEERQPASVFDDPEVGPLVARAYQASQRVVETSATVPVGMGAESLASAPAGAPRSWELWQVGDRLRCLPTPPIPSARDLAGPSPRHGSWLGRLESANGIALSWTDGARAATPHEISYAALRGLPDASALHLRTDLARLTLRGDEKPEWAVAAGRDDFGFWADLEVKGVTQRMRYIPPGRFWMGSPEDEPGRWEDEGPRHEETVAAGFWLADTPCTKALWDAVMGDALPNPSQHAWSSRNPVDSVSWEDCKGFFGKLEELVPGFEARFPSEAEWEYACRAGTETATYAGPIVYHGDARAEVLENIAWYRASAVQELASTRTAGRSGSGSSGRANPIRKPLSGVDPFVREFEQHVEGSSGDYPDDDRTTTMWPKSSQPVATKQHNPWGLYDMLGNVFEWCADPWTVDYAERSRGDSQGVDRVVRGGSWLALARLVRAAYRGHLDPGYRADVLGFRLARGQAAPGSPEAVGSQVGIAERTPGGAGRGTRRAPTPGAERPGSRSPGAEPERSR